MNILVTGSNGQLGTELRLLSNGSPNRYVFSDISQLSDIETISLDITDLDAVRLVCESEKIDVIVNCAAYTNVDKAETDVDSANLINNIAVENLATVAKEREAGLVHISTDYVFNGTNSIPYIETDEPQPIGIYGVTKFAGEQAVINSGCRYFIFRTAWLYSPFGKNFVKTMLKLTSERESLSVVFDQVGTPTYAADLAGVVFRVIENDMFAKGGIYHYSNEGVASWFDFAVAVNELSGNNCNIYPCLSNEYPQVASRPHFSLLDKSKIKNELGISIPYWRDSLKKCLERLK